MLLKQKKTHVTSVVATLQFLDTSSCWKPVSYYYETKIKSLTQIKQLICFLLGPHLGNIYKKREHQYNFPTLLENFISFLTKKLLEYEGKIPSKINM